MTEEDRVPVIEVRNLRHVYDNGTEALAGINIKIYRGDFIGVIGQNGSGKSTFIKHLNGLLRPTAGTVLLNGTDIKKESVVKISRTVGFVFQNPDHQIFCPNVEEELLFGPRNMGLNEKEAQDRKDEAMERFGLTQFAKYPPAILGFGIRRKVSIAGIYSMKPDIMILDEPTVGLDWKTTLDLMQIITELNAAGHTILLVTHDMRVISEYTDRSIVLRHGSLILDGKTRDVMKNFSVLQETRITPPDIMKLSDELMQRGFIKTHTLTNSEFINEYEKEYQKELYVEGVSHGF
ncbi:MAG: ATP-binding cassette domain-containing protein [Treponema sp.]|nr:ATP-binding cassette domain-containing protein [Treponema sp.]